MYSFRKQPQGTCQTRDVEIKRARSSSRLRIPILTWSQLSSASPFETDYVVDVQEPNIAIRTVNGENTGWEKQVLVQIHGRSVYPANENVKDFIQPDLLQAVMTFGLICKYNSPR